MDGDVEAEVPVLRVENLTVRQERYVAVEGVSFELAAGTDTAIVGPNGAGKSTLVQALLGLLPPMSGRVEIFGRPLTRLGQLRYQIGYIPQNFIFDRTFPLAVKELVGLGWVNLPPAPSPSSTQDLRFNPLNSTELKTHSSKPNPPSPFPFFWQRHPAKQQAIAQALERVGAYHLRDRAIGHLSGGELKRVLLAYCLVMPRRLLILDEAFAGIDIQGETDFYTLLNQLKREQNWAVLQISHDLDMVSRHCDRVLCLNRQLICYGRPETALAPENLLSAYGPTFSRYQHHH